MNWENSDVLSGRKLMAVLAESKGIDVKKSLKQIKGTLNLFDEFL